MYNIAIFPPDIPFSDALLRGVAEYTAEHEIDWFLTIITGGVSRGLPTLRSKQRVDGIITYLVEPADCRIIKDVPFINVSSRFEEAMRYPSVVMDHPEIGRMAVRHFRERGYRRVVFIYLGYHFSYLRLQGMQEEARRAGLDLVAVNKDDLMPDPLSQSDSPVKFDLDRCRELLEANDGCGLFVDDDLKALQFAQAVRELGFRIPYDFPILGCNDETLCLLEHPPRSSVRIPAREMGYEAARQLARLLEGKAPPRSPVLVCPCGITTRTSTDSLSVEDEALSKAVAFLRDNLREPIDINQLAAIAGVSRRVLEIRFKKHLQQTIGGYITDRRIQKARELLSESRHSVEQVADLSGFSSGNRLSAVFKKQMGLSPRAFRHHSRKA